jgi:hypothetical protein
MRREGVEGDPRGDMPSSIPVNIRKRMMKPAISMMATVVDAVVTG